MDRYQALASDTRPSVYVRTRVFQDPPILAAFLLHCSSTVVDSLRHMTPRLPSAQIEAVDAANRAGEVGELAWKELGRA